MHAIAAKAVALREANSASYREYAGKVVANASALAATLADRGLRIVSGGTDNHLMLVDVTPLGLTGADAEEQLGAVCITCNKNLIPYDEQPPMKASGIRIGTAAVTTRGLGTVEMERMGGLIAEVLGARGDGAVLESVRKAVGELSEAFPIRPAVAGV
jgi:glycine hydroxymethyltransferase